jgi:cell division protein FtsB
MAAAPRRVILERRRRLRRVVAIVCLAATALLYAGPVRSYLGARTASAQARAQVGTLAQRNAQLRAHLSELGSDAAMEAIARDAGYIKPGETPFVVRAPSP